MMRIRTKNCSYIQMLALNLIEMLNITTYNTKHTRTPKIIFDNTIYIFTYYPGPKKKKSTFGNRIFWLFYGTTIS